MSGQKLRSLRVAAIAVAALGVTACGGEDNAEFIKESNAATSEISAIGKDIGPVVSGAGSKSDEELEQEFASLAKRSGDARTSLDALEAPNDGVKKTITLLDEALGKGETDLETIAEAAATSDADGARTATEALVADSPAISTYNAQLKKETAELEKDE